MTRSYLSIGCLERQLSTGGTERLRFKPGVNLLVGRSNTGKTKWLQTLDYLLGDDQNPFDGVDGLDDKYDVARAELHIGDEHFRIERRWRESGAKTKVFVGEDKMPIASFQQFLMRKLYIPILNFPKGNPMSGQTWPELSFRMLLRHIYRQQRFWAGIPDKQPEGEQHACLLQFLGGAEHLFTEDYGKSVKLKMQVERLKARREQYGETLNELAQELVSEPGFSVGATPTTVQNAKKRLLEDVETLRQRRTDLIAKARDQVVPTENQGQIEHISKERAEVLVKLESLRHKAAVIDERLIELNRYRLDLDNELDRMSRAEDSAAILADLKITHCPACDQPVTNIKPNMDHCFLCHQKLPDDPLIEGLGAIRLQFERERLIGELKEVDELLRVLQHEQKSLTRQIAVSQERIQMIENELTPTRQKISALVQDNISSIDMELGELNERQRQLDRISSSLNLGQELTKRISALEHEIEPLQTAIDETIRSMDFELAASQLEDGMNVYLDSVNKLKPGVWRHSPIKVDVTRYKATFRVGSRLWHAALGGTDTLYFLMAYQYGLLTLSDKSNCHYPGLSLIDLPGDFAGEAIEDKENFIVQPFIDLLTQDMYDNAQLIITGASFAGLENVHREHLNKLYTV